VIIQFFQKTTWFRLLLLGLSGSLAVVLGLGIGLLSPQPSLKQPLVSQFWELLVAATNPSASSGEETDPTILKRQEEQKELEAEIKQLQQQLKSVSDRINQLESELKLPFSEASLETRLQQIQQASQQQNSLETTSNNAPVKITLPSNLLFSQDQQIILTPEGEMLLTSITEELQQAQDQTITIAAHLDASDQIIQNRELSYRQAKAIQQFLAPKLSQSLRWSIIGYGQTRPLTIEEQKLNRRIEIIVTF
jgi:outer membrane protein OmpA-like peptidoglycan-associated protein